MEEECKHPKLPKVEFDEEKAKNMTPDEVRKAYPRGWDTCPDCHQQLIRYASFMHYIAGDW